MANVKRRYDAHGRRAQAERARNALVEVARDLLLRDGYAVTTLTGVARAGGVSVESIYKRFGNKPGLVRAVVEKALLGTGSTPAENRSDSLPAGDADELLRGWGLLTAEVAPQVAPLLLLVRAAAAHDADVAALQRDLDDSRRVRMATNATRLAAAGALRLGVSETEATDVLWTYSSPELYELLVLRSGWPLERYGRFVADGLCAQLLR